ncbi:chromosome transmission fidelity protein 18 homolog [Plodia interpunctella]|uniref:chromosome transmission fidelity protein 18 homolog n=1 Tax=Plodia interpunctella TaxID=58824 RepID=UPI00236838E4|nr:chromosome transmission fidelity protein 18 homolog [Plodia interpunctella]
MSDYPEPDEEYELMYADEFELMRESEENLEPNVIKKKQLPAKRSLDFSSPIQNKTKPVQDAVESLPLTPNLPAEEDISLTPVSSKRTADDLFGDIDDINFDEAELPSKRQKTEEENDMELINRIIESRKLKQMLLEPLRAQSNVKPVFNTKDNISMDIPRWAFMPVTNSDGDRFYVRLESEDTWEKSLNVASEQMSLRTTYSKAWEEAQKFLEEKEQKQQTQLSQEFLPDIEMDINGNNLWVEKYKPKSYVDLLSEEPVNRALLHWLHLWDKIVFKKEVKNTQPQQRSTFVKRTGQFQMTNNWKGKKETESEIDEDGRPHHKVALLCGPPGVGKTTLAHLLAKMAGYRPVELNASDERSTEAFRTALQNATLMQSVLDKDRRPNCLILDEIDGAPLPSVELLVKWCTATVADGKKKAKCQPLRRPVIAICNNLYASSLRPLRPVSHVVQMGGVSLSRLSSRLSAVSAREGLQAAPHAAAAVAARAGGDVRAALLLLRFVHADRAAQLKIEDVMNASIGTKDCNKSIIQALQAIFTVNDKDASVITKTVQAAGDYDRLIDGIFENYLSARVDSRLLIACETLSWLRLYDVINGWTLRNQNYSLYGALPLCITRCHSLLASRTPQRVKFPLQAQEMYRKKLELDSIVESVWSGSSPFVILPKCALRLDLLPILPYLFSPTLRSANIQLCSEHERKALRACAGAACDYGLLQHDVFRLAFCGNEEKIRPSPAIMQAIAREQQLELIRRNEEMANKMSGSIKSSQSTRTAEARERSTAAGETRLPNHLQRLQPKEVEKCAPQVHKDFFGRIVPLSQVQRTEAVPDVISSSNVFYQYREGFNNAVRRNVRTRDLL